ncbi:MAG: hypothetical protein H6550_16315 [Chitinophagales bacterium]|nr:hypothetical protein [Chitinophagales bacterium]
MHYATHEPAIIRVLDNTPDKRHYNLPDGDIETRIQNRNRYDHSRIVYVRNPLFIPGSFEQPALVALLDGEYEVVKWAKK